MKSLAVLLACLVPSLPLYGEEVEDEFLRVLCWNIHHGRGTRTVKLIFRIAGVITRLKPDLAALQEVDRKTRRSGGVDQAATLAKLTEMKHAFGQAMPYDGGQYGVAVLSRREILETRNHPLPASRGFEPRAALATRVALAGMRDLWFMSTHLDHTQDDAQRLSQARKVNAVFADDEPRAIILAGDLNARPDSRVIREFTERWLLASGDMPQPTWPAGSPHSKLDYVLIRKHDAWQIRGVEVIDERIASDHRPLLVELVRSLEKP